MHEWNEQAQADAETKVFRKAATDPEFRALAIRDGRAAVEQATGKKVPEGFVIRFVDPAGAHMTVVLPDAEYEEKELAEHELMAVAGGKGGRRRGPSAEGGSIGDTETPSKGGNWADQ
jgi:hypothetical protein